MKRKITVSTIVEVHNGAITDVKTFLDSPEQAEAFYNKMQKHILTEENFKFTDENFEQVWEEVSFDLETEVILFKQKAEISFLLAFTSDV